MKCLRKYKWAKLFRTHLLLKKSLLFNSVGLAVNFSRTYCVI